MKKISLVIILALLLLCACGKEEKLSVEGSIVLTDDNGNADIDVTNTDFLSKGFNYGDSVAVELENGYKLEDVPFLSGMYVEYGNSMVYGKASKDKVSFIQKYKSFTENSAANEGMKYTIKLNEAGKYKYIEEVGSLEMSYSFEDYNDEGKFANFREVKVGDMKEKRIYRSSSPINDSAKRNEYSAKLALENNIKTVLDVIDKQEEYDEMVAGLEGDPKMLIQNSKVILAPISNDYQAEKNIVKIIEGLEEMSDHDYPYLVFCMEGKDRVGYVMAIVEALCNASYQEIVDDYMTSYVNFYGLDKEDTEKYNYIKETNIDAMLKFITGSDEPEKADLPAAVKSFLAGYGMSEESISKLIDKLCS